MSNNQSNLAMLTPARLGVGRCGVRPLTDSWLSFRADHAVAVDAVLSEVSQSFIDGFITHYDLPVVTTMAGDRQNFVVNPPLGKKLSDEVLAKLKSKMSTDMIDVQIVISDGLSSFALEENLPDLYPMLLDGLNQAKITTGQTVVVKQGRVAVADQIAYTAKARLAVNLIGERPGLSSASSLSAYLTYNPGPTTISSDRTVISNIHKSGTPPLEAGAFIVKCILRILDKKMSGVQLQALG
ncbi:MAG: ethanolamine ammonia-lyase subunit EutC [Candidatus Obscuribacter sp.]|jgi:ethanolamine ammonia-lyase small subunit|nr:ethanolamine ammonia-lyase subunit EutC [Candidatus Obscuribacter sp.]MBK9620379.1 ethanolamine ammonia-lyase subunit EutC [Candidatus Obscuribacter sp.]MBK9773421.1 ethanolamine ammonia-lyase subunit EutC [Candidatus Obscuribacter sp.]MBP6348532.1 ethanolamine ammonia-lyase subunit EutC [Candidatus Obscuribacter sp.]MBP6593405.1 ethanolamine ammonia-lyase subunit EutC [Candidatus Obscuribacter sp.]